MNAKGRWLNVILIVALLLAIVPGNAGAESNAPPPPPESKALGQDVDVSGGTLDLFGVAELTVPRGALSARARIWAHSVEMRLSQGLSRYHPIDTPVTIGATRADNDTPVARLASAATVRIKLNRPEIPGETIGEPGVRMLKASDWQLVPSLYDAATKEITVAIGELPATIAVVDTSKEPSTGEWDPSDPSAVLLDDGGWGVSYIQPHGSNPVTLHYRRSLASQGVPYWKDPITVDSAADSPALVKLGSTLALFYRKSDGGNREVFLRTSTDDGATWSAPSQVTDGGVEVYQLQAFNDDGTVYLFWSLANTSGLLQYRTSSDLSNWSATASVGQPIGPLNSRTYPQFDVKRFSSGTWGLTWLNWSEAHDPSYSYGFPVVWYANSTDLSASNWPNKRELTLPYEERWASGVSLGQTTSGTVYIAYTHHDYAWDYYGFFRTSSDDGATWSSKTIFAYEPSRGTTGYSAVEAYNSYLALDGSGNIRAFWDHQAGPAGGTDCYPRQLFLRDLPSGAITPIPASIDPLAHCGSCLETAVFRADPVNTTTGNFTLPETDVSIPGRGLGLTFQRTYNSLRLADGPLGYGWTDNYDMSLETFSAGDVLIVDGSGRSDLYKPAAGGGYTSPPGRFSTLVHNGDGTWTLSERNQVTRTFSSAGKLTAVADRDDNTLTLAYDGNLLSSVTDPGGRALTFTYSGQRIASISDPLNRTVSYGYNAAGDLTSVTDQRGKVWSYTYDSAHRMLTKVDPNSHTVLSNTYDSLNRVTRQRDAKNAQTTFAYNVGGGDSTVTDPRGNATKYYFDTSYRVYRILDPLNKEVYQYWDGNNNLTRVQDRRRLPVIDNTYFTHGYNNLVKCFWSNF